MIIEKYKAIFIHIPKNAGTSIETLFANSSFIIQPYKHANIHEIKKKFPKEYDSYRKFTVIRNPYDKMVSWYFYIKENSLKGAPAYPLPETRIDFKAWVKEPSSFWYASPSLLHFFFDPPHFLDPQHAWVDNTVEIIKFENLNNELSEFFGEKIDLPITNKSDHNHFSNYYDEESSNIIYDRYKEDFKKYNYKKL